MLFQQVRDGFGFLDGNRSYQHRLPALVELADSVRQRVVFLQDPVHHGFKFFAFRAIDYVAILDADQSAGSSAPPPRPAHKSCRIPSASVSAVPVMPDKLFVHAEIILERDRGQRLVFPLDLHAFFGFYRLVQAVRPAPPGHLPSGKLVDDDHFAVFHHIIHVALIERVRAQSLVHMVDRLHVRRIVQISQTQHAARIC